jgi:hypothetical protein
MCTTASPTKAPHERLNMNFITTSKFYRLQHFLATTNIKAATKPILEIPTPANTPKPQICS